MYVHTGTYTQTCLCIPYTIPSRWTTISADETQPGVSAIHGIRQNEFLGPALLKWATSRNHYKYTKHPTDLSMENPFFRGWPPSLFQSIAPKIRVMWVPGGYNFLNSFSHAVYRSHIYSKRCRVFLGGREHPNNRHEKKTTISSQKCFFPLWNPETNIFAPENGWLENEFPFGFQPIFNDLLVSGRVDV